MDENFIPMKAHLRRSVSNFGFNVQSSIVGIREAKSFTGALQELKAGHGQHDPNCYMKMPTETEAPNSPKAIECITKEASSDQVFIVKHELLNYRGKRYSVSDIAPRWKKDCRTWLWKGGVHKRTKSVSEVRDKMQTLRLPTCTNIFK